MEQPTNTQLLAALNNARLATVDEANEILQNLRNARTSWVFKEELDLRLEIDIHLGWFSNVASNTGS